MRPAVKRSLWGAGLLALLVIVAVFTAPEIEADYWREPLSKELGRALGRPVQVQSVRYRLFPAPGLTALNFVIPEDAAYGLEPFAYVTELQTGVRLLPLLLGRLEVSSVRLIDASVNIARAGDGGWNVSRLLLGMATAARTGNPPALELRACRINFRQGLVKSSFYLNNVDLDLQPPSESRRRMAWSFKASPARTDRAEQGFGRFTGEGAWSPARGPDGSVDVSVELETSALSEVVTLFAGQDLGLQGRLSSRARLDGPVGEVAVSGQVELLEVDRAGLFGFRGRQFSLPLKGSVNLPAQSFDIRLAAPPVELARPPIEIALSSTDTLLDPHWKAEFLFAAFPAATLADLSKRLGLGLPDGFEVSGEVSGSLAFERNTPASGEITLATASLAAGETGKLTAQEAAIGITAGEIRLAPAALKTENGAGFTLSGLWNTVSDARELDLKFSAASLDEMNRSAAALGAPVPLLNSCASGQISGALRYRSVAASPWTGAVSIVDLQCPLDGAAEPLAAAKAAVVVRDDGWTLRSPAVSLGSLEGPLVAVWKSAARRPLNVQVSIAEASAAEIERVFLPTLSRPRTLLDRTIPFRRSSLPSWLTTHHLSGQIHIGKLVFLNAEAAPVDANLFWDGASLELSSLSARLGAAHLSGRINVSLAGPQPVYSVIAQLEDFPWDSIIATLDFDLRSNGIGRALLENLQVSGEAQILSAESGGESLAPFRAAFDYSARRSVSRLRIPSAEAGIDGEIYVGSGLTAADGRLQLDLAGPSHTRRFTITINPWQIENRP